MEIVDQTFTGFQQVYANFSFGPRYLKVHPDRLDVFANVKTITGFLSIQAEHDDFTNLSCFRSLEVIEGQVLKEYSLSALFISKVSIEIFNNFFASS